MRLEISKGDFAEILQSIKNKPTDLFLLDDVRHIVGLRRYKEAKTAGATKVSEQLDHLWEDALQHNLKGVEDFGSTSRTNRLIRPLYAIDRVFYQAANLRALCVGPRTEMELFSLVGQGFQPDNVRGLDLISYSPWIDIGNMHAMPYGDSSFDVLIAGWCLTYSDDPDRACKEFLRVAADKGIIAIGSTYVSPERRREMNDSRPDRHFPRVDDLLAKFGGAVRNVYMRHDGDSDAPISRTIVIFDVRK